MTRRGQANEATLEALGKALLRVTVAGLLLMHGVHKVGHGIEGIKSSLAGRGLPAPLAYGVYLGEVVAPLLVIAGVWSRPAALVMAINMVVAVAVAHPGDVLRVGKGGQWAIELQVLYMMGAVAVALLGPGPYSVSRGRTRAG